VTDFNWQRWATIDEKTKKVTDQWAPLTSARPVKIIAATAANDNTAGNPTGGGASAFITIATMLEWVPLVIWYPKTKSKFSKEACAGGIDIMGDFVDFTGNSVHWADFVNFASRVAKWGMPIWRAAIDVGQTALAQHNPALAKGLGDAARAGVNALANRKRKN